MSTLNANAAISRGLEARIKSSGTPSQAEIEAFNNAKPITPLVSVESLEQLAAQSEKLHADLIGMMDSGATAIQSARDSTIKKLRESGHSVADAVHDKEVTRIRPQHIKDSTEGRLKLLAKILENENVAKASEAMFSSSAAMLQSSYLGNPKRREYSQDLAHAGPNEIQSLAVRAKATNDAPLASALLQAADRPDIREGMPKGWRTDLADHFYGAYFKRSQAALNALKARARSATISNREFAKDGRRGAGSMLTHGLAINGERKL